MPNNEDFQYLIMELKGIPRKKYESSFESVECTLNNHNHNVYENTGKEHEVKLVQKAKRFFMKNPQEYNKIKEDDIMPLPYKPEGAKEIERNFKLKSLKGEIYEAFMVQLSGISGQIERKFEEVINKKLRNVNYIKKYEIEIMDPLNSDYKESKDVNFKLKTDSVNIYMLVIKVKNEKNEKLYSCSPITNRSPKHFSQRESNDSSQEKKNKKSALSYIDKLEDQNKNGMLYSYYDSLIGHEGINKNSIFKLDLYELDDININNKDDLRKFETVISIFLEMKRIKVEKVKKLKELENQKLNNSYPPSPSNSDVSKNNNYNIGMEVDYPSPDPTDSDIGEDSMDIDTGEETKSSCINFDKYDFDNYDEEKLISSLLEFEPLVDAMNETLKEIIDLNKDCMNDFN